MPTVGGKRFPYDAGGVRAALAASKKSGKPVQVRQQPAAMSRGFIEPERHFGGAERGAEGGQNPMGVGSPLAGPGSIMGLGASEDGKMTPGVGNQSPLPPGLGAALGLGGGGGGAAPVGPPARAAAGSQDHDARLPVAFRPQTPVKPQRGMSVGGGKRGGKRPSLGSKGGPY